MDGWGILISRGLSPREVSNSPLSPIVMLQWGVSHQAPIKRPKRHGFLPGVMFHPYKCS